MRFRQQKAHAGPVSLAHKGLPLPHGMQDILPSNLRKNFSYPALLAMQHDRLAFQNSFSVWTTYEIDPYHVYVLLTHIVNTSFKLVVFTTSILVSNLSGVAQFLLTGLMALS